MRQTSIIASLLLLLCGIASAQERIDPRHPDAKEFTEFGRMVGTIDSTKRNGFNIGEQFGHRIFPVGDVNHDGLDDWIVSRKRIDSIQQIPDIAIVPIELLLYKGVPGGLPSVHSGIHIGPTELFCENEFLGAGDFDADGNRDIAIAAGFWGDESYGNVFGAGLIDVIVYWGNDSGRFSNTDTSRLSSTANAGLVQVRELLAI